ncbi:UNC5C-like protein isoform X3 [Leptonychotes weddellii]|uniref:UNC5C-like protein isoform X3 n=1 Tax=Leptonychotes weddellii TaxID=9713 RepID=A0A7F8Q8U1_LEPWE|nr:UNC5C-like protein isoform X3 [Leptonychotes weddellii]XP_030877650.1 UNC5C-like protein isoform X3 [Leptonychotes weddellii]
MCSHESSFQPTQLLLLVGVPVASALLLVQCLRWHCPRWLLGACWKLDSQDELGGHPTPLPENESSRQCPPATLPEMAAFYQELHTPTQGQTIVRQLMHKLLVFSAREVDHRGGCLMLQNTGISLLIPPGAVAVGRQERVSLILVWDLSDAPSLSRAQGLVSPVVACGPHGASFLKPCTLTFKHCAQEPTQARTYSSNTALLDAKAWRPLGRPGAHTSRDECRIQLYHFSLYTCVLEAPVGRDARKWLQLAMFCSPLAPAQSHLQLRIYFLNNTPCALQWAMANEQPHGGCLRGPCQLFDFTGARGDQCLKLKYISEAPCRTPATESASSNTCGRHPFLRPSALPPPQVGRMWMRAVASWFPISTSGMESAPSAPSASGEKQPMRMRTAPHLPVRSSSPCTPSRMAWRPSTWKSSDSRHQRKNPGQPHPLSLSHPHATGCLQSSLSNCRCCWNQTASRAMTGVGWPPTWGSVA